MVKGFNRDERRNVEVVPSQDCTGALIFAKVFLEGVLQRVVNYVLVEPKKKVVIIDYTNDGNEPASSMVVVYGKNMNEQEFKDEAASQSFTLDPGESQKQIEFETSLFKNFKVVVEGGSEVSAGIRIEDVPRVVDPQAVTGGPAGQKLTVGCNFFELPSFDCYTLVFEAEGIGVIGREELLVFDQDGELRQENDA